MDAKIEKNIPIPEAKGTYASKFSRLVSKMEIGDSFLMAGGSGNERNSFLQSSRRYRPMKFTTRTVEGGIRVWRIE